VKKITQQRYALTSFLSYIAIILLCLQGLYVHSVYCVGLLCRAWIDRPSQYPLGLGPLACIGLHATSV